MSPLEVEGVVAEFDGVAQCVVVGIDELQRGEEVCAVVVPTSGSVDLAALAAHVREQLSSYKVPTRWTIATSAQIPTLPSGKFDRKTLRQMVIDGSLTDAATASKQPSSPLR